MAQLNFGGVTENVVTREEFPLEKAREVLKDETIAVKHCSASKRHARKVLLLCVCCQMQP